MAMWRSKSDTVLIVSGENVAVIQGQGTRVEFVHQAKVNWSEAKSAAEDLLKLFPLSRRRKTGEVCLVLPRQMFFSKQIRLPSVDEHEIRRMISLQIGQHLPYPVEQAVWDVVVGQPRGSSSDVLILAVQQEYVLKYLRVLTAAGLPPNLVTVSSNAVCSLLGSLDLTSQKVLFLLEDDQCEFCFCTSDNHFYSSRGIAFGYKNFQTSDLKDFFVQVRLTFEAHRKNFPQSAISTGYFLGGFAKDLPQDFWECLTQESGVTWKELPAEQLAKWRFQGQKVLSTQALAGVAFLSRGFHKICHFLPYDYRARDTQKKARQSVTLITFLVLGVIVALTLAVCAPVFKKWRYVQQLDRELKSVENPFLESRKERALRLAIQRGLHQNLSLLRFFEEIYQIAPQGISLSRIRTGSRNELELEGQALQSSLVNDLQAKMIASRFFRDVRLERSLRRLGPVGEVVQFTISAKLHNPQTEAEGQ